MRECKPVTVPKASFIFCKTSVAVLLWIAFIFKIKWLVIISFIILALSAIFKIQKAPLVMLYSLTVNRIIKSKNEVLDENAMRFAHTLGSILNFIVLAFLYLINEKIGWGILFFVAIAKTAGALGFCSALKLYSCLSSDNCCRIVRKAND